MLYVCVFKSVCFLQVICNGGRLCLPFCPVCSLLCAVGWRWELTNLQNIMATHVSVIKELLLYLACPPSMDTQVILVFRGCLLQDLVLRGPLLRSLSEGADDVVTWQPLHLSPAHLP